jgi:hypothetical protein
MVLRYVEGGMELHGDAEVATNNHFDQDGLAGLFLLCDPDAALARRSLVTDLARAGDFGVYADRRAARASMAIAAMAADGAGYEDLLPLVARLLDEPDDFRDLWVEEDDVLSASEAAVASGAVAIGTVTDVDLAIIDVDPKLSAMAGGHRFTMRHIGGVHPMALHNATPCCRLLVRDEEGGAYRYTDRYETWVQYRSRELPRRVDLRPLAAALTERDTVEWTAVDPSDLSPELAASGSTLAPTDVEAALVQHLRSSPPAWDPYSY